MSSLPLYVPYCGTPPVPAELWLRWNLDPVLIGVLAALMAWHGWRAGIFGARERGGPVSRGRIAYFHAGWAAVAIGLLSPVCALSVSLFAARVTQHMWLMLIAAPLLVFASALERAPSPALPRERGRGLDADVPSPACGGGSGRGRAESEHVHRALLSPMAAAIVFTVTLWLWHAPRMYALTFESHLAYWLMHVTLTGSALWLWAVLARGTRESYLPRIGAGFITLVQMGLLGSLITLAPRLLYSPHVLTAQPWGYSPLEDQQLGGLIMWVPAGTVLIFAALGSAFSLLRDPPDEAAPRDPQRARS